MPVLVMPVPPLFQAVTGDVLEILGDARIVEEQLRVPDLEGFAGAEEQGEIADLTLAAHHRGHEDAAAAVVRHFFRGGEGHQVALLIFELRVGAGLFFLQQALELGVLQRRVGGVVGAEAGKGFVLGENDGARVAAPLDHRAKECGDGDAALCIDRVQRAALEQMLKRHNCSPSQRASHRSREHGLAAPPRSNVEIGFDPRATASVGNSTRQGTQWVFMGYHGNSCRKLGFPRDLVGRKWICSCVVLRVHPCG
ncbi:hypothetical protein H9L13_12105 [Sphingomonas lutea]|uniref:Uncharacterized protein n=1 Tax=Sphingomonas lutea TaxID=1045317 RepID=A0A7G9SHK5_9SPHN|nr:hypothetical protein [Sphingomonas lutea]QNN67330.1 hypothetical protein H9L13_12105 [Sphingomonas lutea]